MIKYHIILAIVLLLFVAGAEASSMTDTVDQVAKDYRSEMGFEGQCYLNGSPVTLAELLYGLGVAEGGFREGKTGMKTNNPGSLHKQQGIKKPVKLIYADGSHTRPVYASMYDGLYEKAHLVVRRYKCSFGYTNAFAYTSGPRADPNSYVRGTKITKMQNAYNWLGNAKNGIKKYHLKKGETTTDKPTETAPIEKVQKGCRWIGTAHAGSRIQIDKHGVAGFLEVIFNWIVDKDTKNLIFIC